MQCGGLPIFTAASNIELKFHVNSKRELQIICNGMQLQCDTIDKQVILHLDYRRLEAITLHDTKQVESWVFVAQGAAPTITQRYKLGGKGRRGWSDEARCSSFDIEVRASRIWRVDVELGSIAQEGGDGNWL